MICPGGDEARLLASFDPIRNACRLEGLTAEHPSFPPDCSLQDRLEGWEEGEIREGVFHVNRICRRSFLYPGLPPFLDIPRNGTAIMTTDAAGVRRAYVMKSPLVNFAAE